MRRPPLPPRDGLGPARLRVHGGPLGDELARRFGPDVAAKAIAGEVVDQHGAVLDAATVLPAGAVVYLYRDLRDEVPVPFDIPVLYQDEDIVVADKPHFLATMPRGRHVAQTALVRLRRQLGLDELSPAHRLDRLTAGVLLFTTHREVRGAYQTLFARGAVHKTYAGEGGGRPERRAAAGGVSVVSSSTAAICRPSRKPASRTPRRWWSWCRPMVCTG